ncbi:Ada metal-binding domain-containing protein [Agriterribacter humi]|jgi:methylphosphotriester-DNA--protein-cysteine methyltransferase|uniref:Ada metal-binding domain-containing protein n=1 Tax=Agriterribacter humi TaxID=1104781 RepID=UPI001265098C|nr:Ada metal-binding domain-containing protein [Agriterribacter humi]
MIEHIALGKNNEERKKKLASLIRSKTINWGGYKKAKIYGLLSCKSGKRMKTANRVFFKDEQQAIGAGYRPCGACLPDKYKRWKAGVNFNDDL